MKKWKACIVMTAVLLASVGAAELVEALGIDTETIQNWMHREQTVETTASVHGEGEASVVSSVAVQNAKVGKWVQPDQDELQYYGLDDFETNLPIVHINTGGQRVSKENKIGAYLSVTEAAEGEARSIMETPDWAASILLNYRGASSYSQFDKKQYRIKFVKKQGSDKAKEVAFLGMGKNSEWVLNGPFLDKTLIRNKLVYDLGREMIVARAAGHAVFIGPEHRVIEIIAFPNVVKRVINARRALAEITPQKRHELCACHLLIRCKITAGNALGHALLDRPLHGACVVAALGHIVKPARPALRSRPPGHAPEEGHDLCAGAKSVGQKARGARAV